MSYDSARRIASLGDVLISGAAAKQRRGRAGRVRSGLCVHLYPSDQHLARFTEPEVRRVPLEQLVMRMKALRLKGSVGELPYIVQASSSIPITRHPVISLNLTKPD